MSRGAYRVTAWLIAILVVVALCLIFPGMMAFAELAARELRYFWWLVLMAAVGLYLIFFFRRRRGE